MTYLWVARAWGISTHPACTCSPSGISTIVRAHASDGADEARRSRGLYKAACGIIEVIAFQVALKYCEGEDQLSPTQEQRGLTSALTVWY